MSTPTQPTTDQRDAVDPTGQLIEMADELVHHLTASSILLRGLLRASGSRSGLPDRDLRYSLALLIEETDAGRSVAASMLELAATERQSIDQ